MVAAGLAILASCLIGVATILMKKAVERTNPTTAMLMVTLVGTIVFLIISWLMVPGDYLKSRALIYFAAAGIFSPALVRWLFFISLDRIGASVSASILAMGPAFTALFAIVMLGETLTLQIGLGIMTIIGGIVIFERQLNQQPKPTSHNRKNLLFPLLAAIFFGFAVVLRKKGLNVLDSPVLGVTAGFTTSLIFYSIMCLLSGKLRAAIAIRKKDLPYFIVTGIFLTTAWLTLFYALSYGAAIVVTPLANLHPLMVLILSYFFLGKFEKITAGIIVGVFIVLAGVLLITTGQA
jgi:uncharacterized membrane protein